MNRKIICYALSLVILFNYLSITVNAEAAPIIGYIEIFSDTDNITRKIKALNNEETIFVSAEDISLITGYDLEIGDFINYSKAGGMDTVTTVDIEFDGTVSAMGKKFEIYIINNEDGIYLPLLQMLFLLHSQWWTSENKLVIRSLPFTIIDFLGGGNYEDMWENKVNQTDLLINGENKLEHVLRTSLAAVFNDFDPEIFVIWWPDKGAFPILNEEFEEALLQIAIDDMDFLNSYSLEAMNSIFEEIGGFDIKSDLDSMRNIIDIPDNIAEGANEIDKIVEYLSKDKALKSYFIYDLDTFDPPVLKAMSEKMENVSNVMDITNIILDVAEVSQRSQNWGEQYINQIRVLTDFDERGYNKWVTDIVKTVASGLIKEYQDPIKAASDEAALQSTSLLLSKIFDESVFGKYFAVLTAGISIAKTNENVRNDMEAADLAYMVDCLVKIEQIAMIEMSRSYSKLSGNNIIGDFTQADLERLRNCTMLSLRTNLRNRAFIYYLNLKLNDDNNWESSIYAKTIQQQIVDDYAKICLLMETERYDRLLFLDDFKNIYSNEYGLVREHINLEIFHKGEIVKDSVTENVSTEESLKNILSEKVKQPILNFIYNDFDNNGNYEAIAFCGEAYLDKEYPELSTYDGVLYFITGNDVKVIREEDVYWNMGEVFKFGEISIFCIHEYSATGARSYLYQVDGNEIIEIVGSGKGQYFSQDEMGEIYMTDSQYDSCVDGTGHTWNLYYFYWDNGLHEYGGNQISINSFSKYNGSKEILKKISEDGYDITTIYKRQNGIININCFDGYNFSNVRVILEDNEVKVFPVTEDYFYEGGIIRESLIPEIATYSKVSINSINEVYSAYETIIEEYKAACSIDSLNWEESASKYSHLNQYILTDYHTPSHYDELFGGDEPYLIVYIYYDIDKNGIPELILASAHHEVSAFAIYAYDGKKAVELGIGGQDRYSSYSVYTNGVITINYSDYYIIDEDGFSLEKIALSNDEKNNLLNYQFKSNHEEWIVLADDVLIE